MKLVTLGFLPLPAFRATLPYGEGFGRRNLSGVFYFCASPELRSASPKSRRPGGERPRSGSSCPKSNGSGVERYSNAARKVKRNKRRENLNSLLQSCRETGILCPRRGRFIVRRIRRLRDLQARIRTAGNFPAFLLYIGGTFAVGSFTLYFTADAVSRGQIIDSRIPFRGVTSLRVAIRGHADCKGRLSFSRPFPVRRAVNKF